MKKYLLNLSMLCLMLLVSAFASADDETTALWDFQNGNPSTITSVNIQSATATVESTLDGTVMTVDATNSGKLAYNSSGYAQFNANTILQVPVKSSRDIVTVTSYPGQYNYTIGGTAADANEVAHEVTASEAAQGYVEIVATSTAYLYCIKAEYVSAVQEKELYSTTFTEWGDYEKKAEESVTTATWQTKYSKEDLTFSIYNTQIGASNFNSSKFSSWEGGMLMAAKSSNPYILTSALASITKVTFVHGATGSNRGWKLEAKGDGDTDWVTISDAVATTLSGTTVNAEVNRTNCQLRFTNLNSSQNAYLLSLSIYGNVDLSATPTLGTFKINGTEYVAGDIFAEDDNGDMVATVKLSKSATMVSESNPLTDIVADNGEVTSTTYTTVGTGCKVTMVVTYNNVTTSYILNVVQKPDYTVTYYNTDGTSLGSQTVEEDATITTFAKDKSDVTVADGKAFRGWFVSADGGRKVTESEVITADLALYAVATDIETASTTARYTYDLTDQYFYDEDHEAINISGAKYYNNHGWTFNADSKTELTVGGNAYILLSLCQYSKGNLTLTDASGNVVSTIDAAGSKDGEEVAIEYTGDATTFTLTGDASYYMHEIVIANMQDDPVEKNDEGIYVVTAGDAASFLNTLMIANATATSDARTIIFLPDGTYDLGGECLTQISGDNISIIGQSMENTIIKNTAPTEGIGVSATLFNTGSNTYMQDLTLQNAYDFYNKTKDSGRAVCLQDKGDRTICKNVEMKSYQDTYYSNENSKFYFETSNIHGNVDFICGEGDVFFNECTITVEPRNADGTGESTMTAPSTNTIYNQFGYVFSGCTIDNKAAKFNYGRAWNNNPRCAYINTTIKNDKLIDNRWIVGGMNVVADKFVEYNTMDENGTVISPSSNKLKFTYGTTSNEYETILTADQAAEYDIDKVFTNWTPDELAAQKSVEGLTLADGSLSWTATDGVTNYAVFKNDVFQGFTTATTYAVGSESAVYSVRAANDMGGLGEAATVDTTTGISSVESEDAANAPYYNIMGIQVPAKTKGLLIQNGKKIIVR